MENPIAPILVGSVLGRYQVLRHIGEGGMGTVYQALNLDSNMLVGLKTLHRLEPDAIYDLKNEFRSLVGVVHPNLVKMHELVCVDEQWFFVMDYVRGVPFVEYCRGASHLSEADSYSHTTLTSDSVRPTSSSATRTRTTSTTTDLAHDSAPDQSVAVVGPVYERLRKCFRQLVDGVNALHALGLVHCDIKPSNVLVTPAGRVLILDFGLTSQFEPENRQGVESSFCGTPMYMAPELFAGESASPSADWYAAGVMLFEALTNQLPYQGGAHRLMSLKLFSNPPQARDLVAETPDDLNDLCVRLLSREPAERPAGSELAGFFSIANHRVQPSDTPPSRLALVGREADLVVLRDAFAASSNSTVQVVVSGESGIGKSALVRAFVDEIADQAEVCVLSGRCYEHESVPYKAFDQLTDALSHYLFGCNNAHVEGLIPPQVAALATLFPTLRRVPAIEHLAFRPTGSDPTQLRLAGFAGLGELLRRLGTRHRLVLVIDDLQWSDADSAVLFKAVFGVEEPPRCLLVTTCRHYPADFLQAERQEAYVVQRIDLRLAGLSEQESRQLAYASGGGLREQQAIDAITSEAKGNPFFLVALARSSAGLTRRTESLTSFMQIWLESLPERAGKMLQVIALAGRPMDVSALANVVETDNPDRDLSTLAAQHFIGAWPAPSHRVECYHDQIREAVVVTLSTAERIALHGKMAQVIEASGRAEAQHLAQHFIAAGMLEKGSVYAERAAQQALQALAFLDAAHWYQRALETAGDEPERGRRLRELLGEALAKAGRGASAAHWLLEATKSAPPDLKLKLQQRAAELLLVSGYVDDGVRVLGEVLSHIQMRLASTPRRALLSLLRQRVLLRLRGLKVTDRSFESVSSTDLLKIDACWSVSLGLSLVDNIRAADFQTRNLRLSLDSGEPYRIARALAMEAAFRATGGSRSERQAKQLSDIASAMAEGLGNSHAISLSTLIAGLLDYLVGRWRAAAERLSHTRELLVHQPDAIWEVHAAQRFHLNSLTYIGDFVTVAETVPQLVKGAQERGNLYAECYLRVRLCCLLSLMKDDPSAAVFEVSDVMQRWSQDGFHLQHYNELFALVSCALYQSQPKQALERMKSTWPALRGSLMLRTQAIRVEVHVLRTRVCLSYLQHVGVEPSVLKLLRRDISTLRHEGVPWAVAFSTYAQGLLYAAMGSQRLAEQWLTAAEQQLSNGEMLLFAAAARWRLGQLAGARGQARVQQAQGEFEAQRILNPERFLQHYAPGPGEP